MFFNYYFCKQIIIYLKYEKNNDSINLIKRQFF